MEVYIIRHGQSTNNALMDDQTNRVKDPALTDVGERQAQLVAGYLHAQPNLVSMIRHKVDERDNDAFPQTITHVYSSAMRRAMQTARPIAAAFDLRVEVWPDLHEFGGIFLEEDGVITGYGGMTRAEILADFPDYILPDSITEAGWYDVNKKYEHFSDSMARAIRVADTLRRRAQNENHSDDQIVLVAHGGFIDILIKAFLHALPSDRFFAWHNNTAITRIDITRQGVVMLRYMNRVSHLTPDLMT